MPRARRIDHVSIAVRSIPDAVKFFGELFDVNPEKVRHFGGDELQGAIFHIGDGRIELLQPARSGDFVDKFLGGKDAGGVHHVTIQVEDLEAFRTKLKEMGINTWGRNDSEGKPEAFIHPRDAYGVLIQLVEEMWEVQPQD